MATASSGIPYSGQQQILGAAFPPSPTEKQKAQDYAGPLIFLLQAGASHSLLHTLIDQVTIPNSAEHTFLSTLVDKGQPENPIDGMVVSAFRCVPPEKLREKVVYQLPGLCRQAIEKDATLATAAVVKYLETLSPEELRLHGEAAAVAPIPLNERDSGLLQKLYLLANSLSLNPDLVSPESIGPLYASLRAQVGLGMAGEGATAGRFMADFIRNPSEFSAQLEEHLRALSEEERVFLPPMMLRLNTLFSHID